MREAKFILPITAGQGAGHDYARKNLLNEFAGYTFHPVSGAWVDHQGEIDVEESIQYICSIEERLWRIFCNIAVEAARLENQKAVYVVSPYGETEIITISAGKVPVLDMNSNIVGYGPDLMPGKPDRIVEKDPEPRYPEVGDLWRTQDQSVVCIVERTMSGKLYGKVLNRGTSGVSYGASVGYTDDGKVDMLEPGPHPLHLKALINRNS